MPCNILIRNVPDRDIRRAQQLRDSWDHDISQAEALRIAISRGLDASPEIEEGAMKENKHIDRLVSLASNYLGTPGGGWGETRQAWLQLRGECRTPEQAAWAIEEARKRGCRVHPTRR